MECIWTTVRSSPAMLSAYVSKRDSLDRTKTAPPFPNVQRRLDIFNQPLAQKENEDKPAWFAQVVWNRDHFRCSCFVVTEADDEEPSYWAFLFAYQQPYVIAVMKLVREYRSQGSGGNTGVTMGAEMLQSWQYEFAIHRVYKWEAQDCNQQLNQIVMARQRFHIN